MRSVPRWFELCLAGALLAAGARAHAAPSGLVLENVELIDGRSNAVRHHVTVIVSGERITAVLPSPPSPLPDSALVLDLSGRWLMPGLVDSHVHISHDPRKVTEDALARALRGGVTAVRDMAGDARRLAALQRDALLGEIDAPDIVYSALFAGPEFFTDPRVVDVTRGAVPGETPWARAVRPSTDLAQAVLLAKGAGCSAVKIYADLPPAELVRIATAAHAAGLKVWGHATVFPSRPSDAVAAGFDVISHASLLYWQGTKDVPRAYGPHRDVAPPVPADTASAALPPLFAAMVRRGTILDATLYVGEELATSAPDSAQRQRWSAFQAYSVAAVRAAHKAGVSISAGTDEMIGDTDEWPNLHEELRLLVSAGFTPMQALQAGTRVSAEAAGALDRFGTVEPGKRANLLVLSADPTVDIANTKRIALVVKAGRLIVGR